VERVLCACVSWPDGDKNQFIHYFYEGQTKGKGHKRQYMDGHMDFLTGFLVRHAAIVLVYRFEIVSREEEGKK
jgi:hypothetical protein